MLTGHGELYAKFTDLISMTSKVETTQYLDADKKGSDLERLRGKVKPPTVTLRRPLTSGIGLADWHALARAGHADMFRNVLLQRFVVGEAARWRLAKAWPSELKVAQVGDVMFETVTLSAEDLIRDGVGPQ